MNWEQTSNLFAIAGRAADGRSLANEILGSGPPPIVVDSDREEDSLQ